eukprot:1827892-Rhodomonas_salina.1
MPITDAARHFNICVTSLKKVCRRLGYEKWPYVKPSKSDRLPSPTASSKQNLATLSPRDATSISWDSILRPSSSEDTGMNALPFASFTPANQPPAPHVEHTAHEPHPGDLRWNCNNAFAQDEGYLSFDVLNDGMDAASILRFVEGTEV